MEPAATLDPSHDLEALAREMWGVHHALARTPRPSGETAADRLELIELELAARDVLNRYTYFYDGKDIDGLMTVFHPDCTLVNPRGTYVGSDAIRRNYDYLMGTFRMVFHYAPNVMVRILEDRRSAWLSSYLFSVGVVDRERFNGNCSSYVARLALTGEEWRIREMRITSNVPLDLRRRDDPMRAFAQPPEPTKPISSRDWIGPEHLA
jgi:SnoaL-like domain